MQLAKSFCRDVAFAPYGKHAQMVWLKYGNCILFKIAIAYTICSSHQEGSTVILPQHHIRTTQDGRLCFLHNIARRCNIATMRQRDISKQKLHMEVLNEFTLQTWTQLLFCSSSSAQCQVSDCTVRLILFVYDISVIYIHICHEKVQSFDLIFLLHNFKIILHLHFNRTIATYVIWQQEKPIVSRNTFQHINISLCCVRTCSCISREKGRDLMKPYGKYP